MGFVHPRPAMRAAESRRVAAKLAAHWQRTSFAVRALPGLEDHGNYPTLDEARGCVAFDGLEQFQIWRGDALIESVEEA
jgi:hypothetical protein